MTKTQQWAGIMMLLNTWRWMWRHREAMAREVQAIEREDFMGGETLHDKNKTRELPTVTVKVKVKR